MNCKSLLLFVILCLLTAYTIYQFESFELSTTPVIIFHNVNNAYNGVAIGKNHFYTINTTTITKHDLISGLEVSQIQLDNHIRIKHLNSGVVVGNRLFVCNNPNDYEFSYNTIEVFDLDLKFQYYIELIGTSGTLIAIDYYDGRWWACFSYSDEHSTYTLIAEMYSPIPYLGQAEKDKTVDFDKFSGNAIKARTKNIIGLNEMKSSTSATYLPVNIKDMKKTTTKTMSDDKIQESVRVSNQNSNSEYAKSANEALALSIDDVVKWSIRNRYYLSMDIINKSRGISGFSFGPDGLIYASGTDINEIYVLPLYRQSNIILLEKIIPLNIDGYGITWDRMRKVLLGINRKQKKVLVYMDEKHGFSSVNMPAEQAYSLKQ